MSDDSMFDKIVEFGMGMTMARQIPQMMDMAIPQTGNTPPTIKTDVSNVYIANNGQQAGPFSEAEVKQLMANGVIGQTTMVWMPKMPQWKPANQVPAINKLFLLSSGSQSTSSVPPAPVANPIRDEVVAAVAQLGYNNANARKIIDEVLRSNPGISAGDAIKEVLKKM